MQHQARRALWTLALIAALGPAAPLLAQGAQEPPPPIGGAEAEEAPAPRIDGAVVGEVRIRNKGVFDPDKPEENKRLFRLVSRLHRTTRRNVIADQILLGPGDPYTPEAVEESERILRAKSYLYEADIRPVPAGGNRVDLEVVTRDVWTLRGGVSLGRAGGENTGSVSLQDSNFLGTGKEVRFLRVDDVDRTSNVLRYLDPNLAGSRVRMELSYADNSDGGRQRFELERPFFSMDARWALGVKGFFDERVDRFYEDGRVRDRFRHERELVEVFGGVSPGLQEGRANRLLFGVTFDRERFGPDGGLDSDSLIPTDRELAYPWIGFESIEDRFVEERQLESIERVEDLNLGRQVRWRLGWSTPALGADRDRLIGEASIGGGWRPTPRQLLLGSLAGGLRVGEEGAENQIVGGRLRYYNRNFGRNVFFVGLEGELGENLDEERQFLLGGDSGLRGYPLRFQEGDRRLLLTLEQRFFSAREFFSLVHLGAAVFFDAGRAWYRDDRVDREILKDVGIGLRIGSSRSSSGTLVHLDLAFPLDGDDRIERVQWLVSTSESF